MKENFVELTMNQKNIVHFYLDSSLQSQFPLITFIAGDLLTRQLDENYEENLSRWCYQSLMLLNTSKVNITDKEIFEQIMKTMQSTWMQYYKDIKEAVKNDSPNQMQAKQTLVMEKHMLKLLLFSDS